MNYIKQLNRSPDFIRLQVANKVPASSFPAHQGNLCVRFLDAVFAEVNRSSGYRLLNRFGRMRLADRHQGNVFRFAT
jgi:hypothetical protein